VNKCGIDHYLSYAQRWRDFDGHEAMGRWTTARKDQAAGPPVFEVLFSSHTCLILHYALVLCLLLTVTLVGKITPN
jgi:hypothetical protein